MARLSIGWNRSATNNIDEVEKKGERSICVQQSFTAPSMSGSNRSRMPHCMSQRMPLFGSPMPASAGRIYGPIEGKNPFNQGGDWAMNGWELLKRWDRR